MIRFNYYYLNEKSKSTFSLSMGSQIRLNFKICSIGANIDNKKNDKKQIRNSTVDFLVFTKDTNENGIEVRIQNGTVWLTQNAISDLFDVDRSVINKHLKNIFKSGELEEAKRDWLDQSLFFFITIIGNTFNTVCHYTSIPCISLTASIYSCIVISLSSNFAHSSLYSGKTTKPSIAREAAALFIALSFLGLIKSTPNKIIIYETKQTIKHFAYYKFTKPDNENRPIFLTTNPTKNEKKLCQVMPSYVQK